MFRFCIYVVQNEKRIDYNEILVDNARPSSPSQGDQGRQEYRRAGFDKQGEVGAGSSKPEFVS